MTSLARRTEAASDDNEFPKTLFDKVWQTHEVHRSESGQSLLWVDRHFVHEGSFHAFNKLSERQLPVARPDLTFGIADHYVPTQARDLAEVADTKVRSMIEQLSHNTQRHGVTLFGLEDPRQGIVHVLGPSRGLLNPVW